MKKALTTIFLIVMILTVAGVALVPNEAEAGCLPFNPMGCVTLLVTYVGNTVLMLTAQFLFVMGVVLNMAMILTLNIKAVYEATPAIESMWVVIRNISSIFIIFGLLYTSVATILDASKTSVKKMVGSIIMAGLLINFSLFFTKILIDTSNIVSMQFYRAIAPDFKNADLTKDGIGKLLSSAYKDGGISNIFQQSLKIPKLYTAGKDGGFLKGINVLGNIQFATYGGAILMIIAGLSFFAAALAFIVRLIMLLLAMAFSPLFFVGMIFPKIQAEAKTYVDKFIGQLTFMPIYLLLMYVALRFISDGDGKGFFASLNTGQENSTGNFILAKAGLAFQYIIAIIVINIPLVAALKAGAMAPKWAGDIKDMAGKWTKNGAAAIGRNSYGALASKVADSNFMKTAASKNALMAGTLKGIRGVASSYNETTKKQADERVKFGESLGYNKSRVDFHDTNVNDLKNQIDEKDRIINNPSSLKADVDLAKSDKKALQKKIRYHENKISEEKRGRQIAYAQRVDPRDIDPDTGKLKPMSLGQHIRKVKGYVAKDEELGSSQIHVKNTEAEVEQLKKELDDKKKEQDTIKNDIKRIDEQDRQGRVVAGDAQDIKRGELKNDLHKLLNGDPAFNVKGIIDLGKEIRDKELEVKRYKNLS